MSDAIFVNESTSAATPASGYAGIRVKSNRLKLTTDAGAEIDFSATGDLVTASGAVSTTDVMLGKATAGAGAVEEIPCTAFARSILDDANEATFKATVNLEIGTDVQAYDATLASIATLGTAADKYAYTTGVDTWAEGGITSLSRGLLAGFASYTWAGKPAASGYSAGLPIYISDVGGGSWWMSTGTQWVPAFGPVNIGSQYVSQAGIANTDEQILQQFTINAALLQAGFEILPQYMIEKSGASETCTTRIRIGALGTTADAVVFTNTSLTGALRTVSAKNGDFIVTGDTGVRPKGIPTSASALGVGAVTSDVTIDNISNALIVSFSAQMSAGVETATLKSARLEVKR